ncbi:hypothetical protein OQH61_07405 [Helicobacter sp. MIT 21-1697]|uniref:hypothetical protein n=1 Tax=Helicobacter sp. MIT 21-1697 TaxID=2993733 RepID=UPI00224B974F|nr:hypothetical protein [Helicobacter sp. MIT 21-1697]MCX2717557.1 hypothetical protein [Helicobacter sp. MIT 21-1697]
MKVAVITLCLCVMSVCAGEWVMFSDGKDTYIYSTNTGEVYVRHSVGKKNYEDIFVKMPRGMQPNELRDSKTRSGASSLPSLPTQNNIENERLKDIQFNALKKSQDMLNSAID